jgi:hypothetical protein
MRASFCLAFSLLLFADHAVAQDRLKRFIGSFAATLEQRRPTSDEWTAEPMPVDGQWIVAGHYAEVRGSFRLHGFDRPIELVFVFSFDPFQKEYRAAVLDDYAGLLDVFEQEEANPLTLSNVGHGTYFSGSGGQRGFSRMVIDFLDAETTRLEFASSVDRGKSWRTYARLTLRPRRPS